MARRFTDAIGLLNDLLNRFEAGPQARSPTRTTPLSHQ
ncbi:hypothetical protein ACVME8_004797 [Bradyrhizobium diazoefficiens]